MLEAVATDPVNPDNLYIAAGMYTNEWDPDNGTLLISHDRGDTFPTAVPFPFKFGGNMPGRGLGERLVVDPNNVTVCFIHSRILSDIVFRIIFSILVHGRGMVFGGRQMLV